MQRREAIVNAMASKDPLKPDRRGQEVDLDLDIDTTPVVHPDAHHYIAASQRQPSDLLEWVHKKKDHPGIKVRRIALLLSWATDRILRNDQEFIPRLKDHVLAHRTEMQHYGEEYVFTDAEIRQVKFTPNRIYEHPTIRVNYTTYDMRRAQDYINVRKGANIMVLAHEDDDEVPQHPYWYARVLGVYHVNVQFSGESETHKTDFLWVQWYRRDPDHQGGFGARRLHRIGLMDPDDIASYGFIDPSDIIRAIHLIPAFDIDMTFSRRSGTQNDEIDFYYVSM